MLVACIQMFVSFDFECMICRKYHRRYPNFIEGELAYYLLTIAACFSILQIILYVILYKYYVVVTSKSDDCNNKKTIKSKDDNNNNNKNNNKSEIASQATTPTHSKQMTLLDEDGTILSIINIDPQSSKYDTKHYTQINSQPPPLASILPPANYPSQSKKPPHVNSQQQQQTPLAQQTPLTQPETPNTIKGYQKKKSQQFIIFIHYFRFFFYFFVFL